MGFVGGLAIDGGGEEFIGGVDASGDRELLGGLNIDDGGGNELGSGLNASNDSRDELVGGSDNSGDGGSDACDMDC